MTKLLLGTALETDAVSLSSLQKTMLKPSQFADPRAALCVKRPVGHGRLPARTTSRKCPSDILSFRVGFFGVALGRRYAVVSLGRSLYCGMK
jgi:hypothetical protein